MSNYILAQIASKADYIADLARNAKIQLDTAGDTVGIVGEAQLKDILQQLENIADAVGEYHSFDE